MAAASGAQNAKMVPTDAVIKYRFKNALESEIHLFPFTGTSVSVKQLKLFVSNKHKLEQKSSRPDKTQAASELEVLNLSSGEREFLSLFLLHCSF